MSTPLDALHAAIQAYSNALADEPGQVGVLDAALVVWQEASFDEHDGTVRRQILYATTGDGNTPILGLGLATHLLRTLERDIIGCDCGG